MDIGGPVDLADLRQQVKEFEQAHGLREDDAFVAWFLRAYILDDEGRAKAALTDDSGERAIDGIHIDDSAQVVHLVQGKFHGQINKHMDTAAQVQEFTDWADRLYGPGAEFQAAITGIGPIAHSKLKDARNRLYDRQGYRLVMYWVSTGRASKTTIEKSERDVRRVGVASGRRGRFEFIGGTRVLELLHDYLYGVAPVVPMLELPVSSEVVRSKDPKTGIVLRAFQMKGDDLAHLVDIADVRLFALNIRSYLRDTQVNKNMKATLKKEPENFLYYNNGVTFVCDSAAHEDPDAADVITLVSPQIINGQQTTRVLHEVDRKEAAAASVLVRVIAIPRAGRDATRHETLISRVVQATNWQNSIKLSDLKSNDTRQVVIERGFRRLGNYHYARKTEPKRDTRAKVGKGVTIIPRNTLAQAVAGCRVESLPLRGIETLFDEYYEEIFANYKMKYYLTCYWLWRAVQDYTGRREDPVERKRAKWLTLYHAYQELYPTIKKHPDILIEGSEQNQRHPEVMKPFFKAIDTLAASCTRFYRAQRGEDGLASDPTNFFKSQGLHDRFLEFWPQERNKTLKVAFDKARDSFVDKFEAAESE